ncbi:hypothetical protein [Massilia sp. Root335]|jgi:hypothetical protein|uniref:post-PEP-CTERM-1 domain-containing protein n=1 Tax=Massilia sp. Root335 TaxID=1736517 RepID=UPI0006F5941B|nr:hypothetical protein [Massilia sp. Root335]KQV27257.1 hypothetical protein ASC93_28850 [Massilia sp. Root335]
MSKEKLLTIGTLAALCLMAVFSLHAKAAGQEGMVVVRDPQTGKMRAPTPDELRDLRARAPASAGLAAPRAPSTVSRGDGSRGVRLGDKTMVYDVVTRGADGKLTSECVQGEAAVGHALDHNHGEKTHESR